jgi:hypothetical protein
VRKKRLSLSNCIPLVDILLEFSSLDIKLSRRLHLRTDGGIRLHEMEMVRNNHSNVGKLEDSPAPAYLSSHRDFINFFAWYFSHFFLTQNLSSGNLVAKDYMDLNSTTTSSPTNHIDLEDSYRPLPSVYLVFLAIWAVSGFSWGLSSWRNRHYQVPFLFLQFLVL